ncbi:hypothetical protein PSP31121_04934 [Pandoraea sputorum]|uniref:Uncharacterized protein n=1 Tax=Pandoraea sputorum TaxID=93222 RepID=A0A5E5BFV8_9BURK|nr:hypothetical protein PSP31121_04934 [Pandoraea sputorum]
MSSRSRPLQTSNILPSSKWIGPVRKGNRLATNLRSTIISHVPSPESA